MHTVKVRRIRAWSVTYEAVIEIYVAGAKKKAMGREKKEEWRFLERSMVVWGTMNIEVKVFHSPLSRSLRFNNIRYRFVLLFPSTRDDDSQVETGGVKVRKRDVDSLHARGEGIRCVSRIQSVYISCQPYYGLAVLCMADDVAGNRTISRTREACGSKISNPRWVDGKLVILDGKCQMISIPMESYVTMSFCSIGALDVWAKQELMVKDTAGFTPAQIAADRGHCHISLIL
ncbi:hypothetical protein L2E82_01937 [Cichorium intybus]|uniref:Uncharacterized protein n=1 Tax=Cichorium intybus TaxID=13427 RepID=A0ACB9H085_CICIN|nr:hypothetical protein L2E82_01937 [Cichorium intybus]